MRPPLRLVRVRVRVSKREGEVRVRERHALARNVRVFGALRVHTCQVFLSNRHFDRVFPEQKVSVEKIKEPFPRSFKR